MKTIFKIIAFIVITINSNYAQITTSINYVFLNSQTTVTNCNTLDFGTIQNNDLVFYFKLERPQSLPSGTGTLRIMLINNSSPQVIGAPQNILDSFWANTTYESTIGCAISASQVQQSGSTIYLEFETSGGIKTKSCDYPITKTPPPSFSLSPTTLSLACGDTNQRTFTITPANIPAGANVSYSWSHPGWALVSSTATSRTLQPNSGTTLPSNITLTPSINGVVQATKTRVVSRAPFNTSTLSISGNSYVCDTGIYTINNLPSSVVIQSVTSSNNNIATVSLTGTNEILVTKVSDGVVSITATIQNTCNQTATISKENIQIGIPSYVNDAVISGSKSICGNQMYTYTITNTDHPCNTDGYWTVSSNLQIVSSTSTSITVTKDPFNNQNSGYISYSIPNTNVEIRKGVWVGLPEILGLNIQKIGSYDFYAGSWTTLKATYSALIYPESGNYNLTYEWNIPNSYVRNYTDTAYKDVNPRSSDQLNIGIRAWNECGCTDWFYKLFDVISAGTGGGGTGGGGNVLTPAN